MLRWALVFVCLVVAPGAAADAFTEGQQYYRADLYARAYEAWAPLARNGNVDAQYALGVMHDRGEGVEKDKVTAARWYALAAAKGHQPSVLALRALAPDLRDTLETRQRMEKAPMAAEETTPWLPPVPVQKPPRGPFFAGTPPVPALRIATVPRR
jgi:hypothetical protein